MANATPRGHALPVSRKNHRASAQAVFVLKLARQDIGNDLHIVMGMRRETAAGRNPIFIDHAQRAEAHPLRIGVIVKTESMARLQPAVVAAATLIARSDGHHRCSLLVRESLIKSLGSSVHPGACPARSRRAPCGSRFSMLLNRSFLSRR